MTTTKMTTVFDPSRYYYLVGGEGKDGKSFDVYETAAEASQRLRSIARSVPKESLPKTYVIYDWGPKDELSGYQVFALRNKRIEGANQSGEEATAFLRNFL